MFALLAPEASFRDQGLMIFKSLGVGAVSHYENLATSPAGQEYGKVPNPCINPIRFVASTMSLVRHNTHLLESYYEESL